MSIGGAMNSTQPDLLQGAIDKLPSGGQLTIATDADECGRALAGEIKVIAHRTNRTDITVVRAEADHGKDWNDHLQAIGLAKNHST